MYVCKTGIRERDEDWKLKFIQGLVCIFPHHIISTFFFICSLSKYLSVLFHSKLHAEITYYQTDNSLCCLATALWYLHWSLYPALRDLLAGRQIIQAKVSQDSSVSLLCVSFGWISLTLSARLLVFTFSVCARVLISPSLFSSCSSESPSSLPLFFITTGAKL